jgi:hypothetical protein
MVSRDGTLQGDPRWETESGCSLKDPKAETEGRSVKATSWKAGLQLELNITFD